MSATEKCDSVVAILRRENHCQSFLGSFSDSQTAPTILGFSLTEEDLSDAPISLPSGASNGSSGKTSTAGVAAGASLAALALLALLVLAVMMRRRRQPQKRKQAVLGEVVATDGIYRSTSPEAGSSDEDLQWGDREHKSGSQDDVNQSARKNNRTKNTFGQSMSNNGDTIANPFFGSMPPPQAPTPKGFGDRSTEELKRLATHRTKNEFIPARPRGSGLRDVVKSIRLSFSGGNGFKVAHNPLNG
jgi:MYXO-CTERM domain-containing protein